MSKFSAQAHHPDLSSTCMIKPDTPPPSKTYKTDTAFSSRTAKSAFESLLHKVPHQSLERMVAIAICLHGDPDKCNSRVRELSCYFAGDKSIIRTL